MNNLRANAFQHLKTGTTSRVWTSIDGEEIEEFRTMKESLENALHHYKLLQADHEKLLREFQAKAESRPLRKGAKVFRRVMRMLSARDERHTK